MHYHLGAIHPIVPDPSSTPSFAAAETWRQSDKPMLRPNMTRLNMTEQAGDQVQDENPSVGIKPSTSYKGHTWLLTSDNRYDLLKTPMGINSQTNGGDDSSNDLEAAWKSWAVAAQQHYSLLINLEHDEISRYYFGSPIPFPKGRNAERSSAPAGTDNGTESEGGPGGEQLYDTQYKRYNLNFMAIWGHDVAAALPMDGDDEQELTVTMPKRVQRPFVIDARAIVSHFSFYPQHDGMKETDLLDRYRAYANEMVCRPNNRKSPFDLRCQGF